MQTKELIQNLYNDIKSGVSYSVFLSDAENMDAVNTALEESGAAVIVSRVSARSNLSTTTTNKYLRNLTVPILVFTNPATEGCPDVNDIIDALEKVISSMAVPGSIHYWKLDTSSILEDTPQNAFLTLEYTYNTNDL